MPQVSVIIPAHDAATFLPEALRSVEAQTFTDWEIVAVDDGSHDETWSILQSAGPQVKTLRNSAAVGPAATRNRALAEASGDLIVFLDADDFLLPNYLERQIACLDAATTRGRRVGLIACDAFLLDAETSRPHTLSDMIRDWNRPLTLELVLRRNPIHVCSLVPRTVGESVGWFDPELFGTEDFGLWIKILEGGSEAILNPEPLCVYRRRPRSLSSDIARHGVNNRRVYELALARGRLNGHQRRIARRAIRYNRAMEEVAIFRFAPEDRSVARLVRGLPRLLWVAATNPRWWPQWLTILRTGRQPAVARRPLKWRHARER